MKPKPIKKPVSYTIELNVGSEVLTLPVVIRKHAKSQRMVIRYHPTQHHVVLTLPRYVTIKQGLHFVEEKRNWIAQRIQEHTRQVPFADGNIIPLLGMKYTLRHVGGRGVVRIAGGEIIVPGAAEFMVRRVREFLKRVAHDTIAELAHEKAKIIGKQVKKITVRDTSSRWGSCSYDGNLSFSWRLVFAPFEILEYVTCHEVAHLKHHDHSKAFWMATGLLYPDYDKAKDWLKLHGSDLYAYG